MNSSGYRCEEILSGGGSPVQILDFDLIEDELFVQEDFDFCDHIFPECGRTASSGARECARRPSSDDVAEVLALAATTATARRPSSDYASLMGIDDGSIEALIAELRAMDVLNSKSNTLASQVLNHPDFPGPLEAIGATKDVVNLKTYVPGKVNVYIYVFRKRDPRSRDEYEYVEDRRPLVLSLSTNPAGGQVPREELLRTRAKYDGSSHVFKPTRTGHLHCTLQHSRVPYHSHHKYQLVRKKIALLTLGDPAAAPSTSSGTRVGGGGGGGGASAAAEPVRIVAEAAAGPAPPSADAASAFSRGEPAPPGASLFPPPCYKHMPLDEPPSSGVCSNGDLAMSLAAIQAALAGKDQRVQMEMLRIAAQRVCADADADFSFEGDSGGGGDYDPHAGKKQRFRALRAPAARGGVGGGDGDEGELSALSVDGLVARSLALLVEEFEFVAVDKEGGGAPAAGGAASAGGNGRVPPLIHGALGSVCRLSALLKELELRGTSVLLPNGGGGGGAAVVVADEPAVVGDDHNEEEEEEKQQEKQQQQQKEEEEVKHGSLDVAAKRKLKKKMQKRRDQTKNGEILKADTKEALKKLRALFRA